MHENREKRQRFRLRTVNNEQEDNPGYEKGWVSVPMVKNGNQGEVGSQEDVYSALIPPNENRSLIRYRIIIEDSNGIRTRAPFTDGGYHGGWGGAARMRIYEELSNQKMLTDEEEIRFEKIVKQSLESRFIDFKKKAQSANNHSFGNAGGIALALKLFPDSPQANEARAWINRIWENLSEFGDWTEWNYYPYGPIFLHGLIDIAEVTGRIKSDKELINSVGNSTWVPRVHY